MGAPLDEPEENFLALTPKAFAFGVALSILHGSRYGTTEFLTHTRKETCL
jgi:hypothetical protein